MKWGIYKIKYSGEKVADLIRVTSESYGGMFHGIRLRPMPDARNEELSSRNLTVSMHDHLVESSERVA